MFEILVNLDSLKCSATRIPALEDKPAQRTNQELSKRVRIPFIFTVGSKIIRELVIILAIFLRFDFKFLSSPACYEQDKA